MSQPNFPSSFHFSPRSVTHRCARLASLRPDTAAERCADDAESQIARLNADLSECPFCGEHAGAIVEARGEKYRTECDHCGAATAPGDDPAEAFASWNHRTPAMRRFLKLSPSPA